MELLPVTEPSSRKRKQPPPKSAESDSGDISIPPTAHGEADILAVIAEMAAGAAHELNNPLAVISGRAQLMREKAASDGERKIWLLIAEQSQRISDIITEMMRFASPPPVKPEPIKVGNILAELIFYFSSIKLLNTKAAKFDRTIEGQVPDIWADRAQVLEVMRELVTNSLNAAKTSPYIYLSAKAVTDASQVLLTVRDNGPGMDSETLVSAFTPFFSSQAAGRRRGLGLPMVWRYVVNNHGRIWIESQPGRGTTVFVLLPTGQ
jgi:signal transduction histidine kinase